MRTIFLASLLALASLPALPFAAAHDPCGSSQTVLSTAIVDVGVFQGDCVGVHVGVHLVCAQVLWGVMTPVAGVGGHHRCEARAYAALP